MKNRVQVYGRNLFRYFTEPKSYKTSAILVMLASLLGVSANAQLLHRYDFNTTNDTVGTANGTLTGGATLSGGALVTAGGDGAVSGLWGNTNSPMMILNPSAVSGITNAFSLESWFSCSTGWPKYDSLFAFSDGTEANYVMGNPVMGFSPWPSGCNIAGGSGSNGASVYGIYLDSGATHQVVLTYNGTNFTWYIDGAIADFYSSATATDLGFNLSTLQDIGINGGSPFGDPCLTGSTYDFRIYGQGVSALQIAQLYVLGSDAANSAIEGVVTPAPATAFTWDGLGGDNNWGTGLNWVGGTAPATNGTILTFAGSARTSPNLETSYNVNSLIFSNNASSFTIGSSGGSVLKLTGIPVEVDSTNPQTLNLTVADNGVGLVKSGNGTLNLPGANTYVGQTVVSNGTLNVSGSLASTANITIGAGAGNSVLGVSGTLSPNMLLLGNVSNAVSAVYQTGGTVTATANTGADNLSVGSFPGAYGYYAANGGTATINGICVAGENGLAASGGNGILDINGGTVNCTGWFVMARNGNAQTGVVNLYSGSSLTYAGGGMICNWGSGQTTMINVLGGTLATAANNEIGFLNGTGIVNLLGGLTSVSAINGGWGAPNGQVNFNGGTLQPIASTTAFLAVTAATVYKGGGTIDNAGWTITIGQPLLAPAGNGVTGISSFTGGAGYIAPPIVTITNAAGDTTGAGATAIAQVNPVTGTVTNILITCPGTGYTLAPMFTFAGGGATTPASVTGVTIGANASGGLTFVDSTGSSTATTLTGANTYTGSTTISPNTILALAGSGSLASTNIIVSSSATFDVSGTTATYALGAQALSGFGNVNGTLSSTAGSKIYPGTDGTVGTLVFNNNLTLNSGASCNLDVSTSHSANNDLVTVTGTLALSGNQLHLKAPSTSVSLDTTGDYVLITATSITGAFASTPVWDVAPLNAINYTVVTSSTNVVLHFTTSTPPTVTAVANPSTVLRNQSTTITANVIPGTGTVDSNTGVTLNLLPLGGTSIYLVRSNTSSLFTNTIVIPAAVQPASLLLTVTAVNGVPLSGSGTAALIVTNSNEVWDGAGSSTNWSINQNWVSGFAPGLAADTLTFAGSATPAPNMDNNYSVNGLIFGSTAGNFNIGSAGGNTLTLTGAGVLNNSANAETLNVPIALGAAQTFNAAAGTLVLAQSVASGGNLITVTGVASTVVSGPISGSGSLFKQGSGSLTISSNSAWSGTAASSGGFSGPLIAQAGTLTFNNGGTSSVNGELVIGGVVANGGAGNNAKITIDGSTLNANSWFSVGRGNGIGTVSSDLVLTNGAVVTAANMSDGYNGGNAANLPKGTVTLYNASSLTVTSALNLAESPGSVMTMTLNNSSQVIANGTAQEFIGEFGSGTLNLNDNSAMVLGTGIVDVGYRSGTGVVNVASSAVLSVASEFRVGGSDTSGTGNNGYGTVNMSGGQVNLNALTVARGNNNQNGVSGVVNVNGGVLISTNDIDLGFAGTGTAVLNIGGTGTVDVGPTATKWLRLGTYDYTRGQMNITGGNLNLMNNSSLKFSDGVYNSTYTTNVVTQSGGTVTFYSDAGATVGGTGVVDLQTSGGTSINNTYNLNGGVLIAPAVVSTAVNGQRVFNFNGGSLKAALANTSFMSLGTGNVVANVRNGGAIIDDGGFAITMAQALVHSTVGGDNATDGGLTKNGTGKLTLSGANTYTGNTTVNAGTLELAQAVLATNASVTITNGAVLQLDFATTNTIAALVLNGTNQAPGLYNSTTAAPFLTGTGSLLVASTIASNPTNITFTVTGGTTLALSWPADHLGWILQQQTNSVSVGLGTNWVDVAGSATVTSTNITINHAVPTAFYRLRHP